MMNTAAATPTLAPTIKTSWREIIAKYQQPSIRRALWQLANTFVPYLLLWYLMYLSLSVSWWLTIPLAVLASGFLVRIFIIFHDCGHGSYFRSRRANDIVGFIFGILTFTPYEHWRSEHATHHSSSGHLDKRGTGDIWTMTVQEYLDASRLRRFAYRLSRSPFVLFVLAPWFLLFVLQRFPSRTASRPERHSVWLMNLLILCLAISLSWIFGFTSYLLIQLTITMVGGAAGVWLFYVQHQFEDVYWERGNKWDYTAAALRGSSFYKLPRILQWFSGNIGFHHIHHLSARVPNYNLQRCHEANPFFQKVKPMTLLSSFKSLKFHLWDEKNRKLISFGRLRQLEKEKSQKEKNQRINSAHRSSAGP